MQKDVIYIDVEDDVTSIIGKIKAANSNIVALVPPKRIGAIQSAVNLKLVHRAAERVDKKLVIITNNDALSTLAGSAGIPVAKNLQSRPELAEIPALEVNSDDDVIDGSETLNGGAKPNAQTLDDKKGQSYLNDELSKIEDEGEDELPSSKGKDGSDKKSANQANDKSKKSPKIPDFNTFRKKFFIIGAAVILLIAGLVWAFVFAPRAQIVISAQTSSVAVNTHIKSSAAVNTSLQDGTVKLTTKTREKAISKTFTATGKKDVGEKATGIVSFSTRDIDNLGTEIPAGTTLTTDSGAEYVTSETVKISLSNYRNAKVKITAARSGASYNGASGTVKGAPSGISASISGSTTGGTDKTITVVQQSDINKAMRELVTEDDKNQNKAALQTEFGKDYTIINESFAADVAGINKPAVDSEANDGQAAITGTMKFSLSGIARSEFDTFLKAYCQQRIDGKSNQKIYDTGSKTVSLTNIAISGDTINATVSANGKVGPKIDEDAIKEYVKGQSVGEVQERVKTVEGIKSVDVSLSPFWVYRVPDDTKKISVKFQIDG